MGWLEKEVVYCDVLTSGGMVGYGGASNVWRPHAVGEAGVFQGGPAIGPCVDNKRLTLG